LLNPLGGAGWTTWVTRVFSSKSFTPYPLAFWWKLAAYVRGNSSGLGTVPLHDERENVLF
jgi:hypothetical protein